MISTPLNHILTQYKDMQAMSSDFSTVHFECSYHSCFRLLIWLVAGFSSSVCKYLKICYSCQKTWLRGESEFAHSGFIYYSLHIGYIFNLY